ncbi:MAG: hypothetical protein ABSE82_13940 [Nitrososphaerales archaeon]|jgi:uncharacterized SAM-dependent methyltransferase
MKELGALLIVLSAVMPTYYAVTTETGLVPVLAVLIAHMTSPLALLLLGTGVFFCVRKDKKSSLTIAGKDDK